MKHQNVIYLDYAATTPVDPRVVEAMMPYFSEVFGNPSSIHMYGQKAKYALEEARATVAGLLNVDTREIIFTGCGTESDNLALRGTAFARSKRNGAKHILISPIEHHAIIATAEDLQRRYGFEVEYLPVDQYGLVSPADVANAIRKDTALVSVFYANNEIGTVNPVAEIGVVCREQGVPFHSDAVQATAHIPINIQTDSIDMMAIGAHKFYGPKGVGALYLRSGMDVIPFQSGGSQENGLRPGTENLPYIMGLAEALKIARFEMTERSQHLVALRDFLISEVISNIIGVSLTGHPSSRLPNHASFAFEGVDGNTLIMMLDQAGFACSSGSACNVGKARPSSVLMAMGFSEEMAKGALRVTIGAGTTQEHLDLFVKKLPDIINRVRSLN